MFSYLFCAVVFCILTCELSQAASCNETSNNIQEIRREMPPQCWHNVKQLLDARWCGTIQGNGMYCGEGQCCSEGVCRRSSNNGNGCQPPSQWNYHDNGCSCNNGCRRVWERLNTLSNMSRSEGNQNCETGPITISSSSGRRFIRSCPPGSSYIGISSSPSSSNFIINSGSIKGTSSIAISSCRSSSNFIIISGSIHGTSTISITSSPESTNFIIVCGSIKDIRREMPAQCWANVKQLLDAQWCGNSQGDGMYCGEGQCCSGGVCRRSSNNGNSCQPPSKWNYFPYSCSCNNGCSRVWERLNTLSNMSSSAGSQNCETGSISISSSTGRRFIRSCPPGTSSISISSSPSSSNFIINSGSIAGTSSMAISSSRSSSNFIIISGSIHGTSTISITSSPESTNFIIICGSIKGTGTIHISSGQCSSNFVSIAGSVSTSSTIDISSSPCISNVISISNAIYGTSTFGLSSSQHGSNLIRISGPITGTSTKGVSSSPDSSNFISIPT